LIHLASIDLYRWLNELPSVPTTCTHQDIESDLLRQRAETAKSRLLRWYIRHQADLVEDVERHVCPKFTTNIVMSDVDASRLRRASPESDTFVVPNGVDTDFFEFRDGAPYSPDRICFVGPTYSFSNKDAVTFFLEEIWQAIRSARPSASLQLVGDGPASVLEELGRHPGVVCLGRLPDIRPHLSEAACSIVPIRYGGGTRLKVLESWAVGTPVVSTSVGCEGLGASDGHNILIRDQPAGFAAAVLQLIEDPGLRAHLAVNGRRNVDERYSWDAVGQRLRDCYWSLLGDEP
jgi:glycosyltransferase involved in cell wall biosynthesis